MQTEGSPEFLAPEGIVAEDVASLRDHVSGVLVDRLCVPAAGRLLDGGVLRGRLGGDLAAGRSQKRKQDYASCGMHGSPRRRTCKPIARRPRSVRGEAKAVTGQTL